MPAPTLQVVLLGGSITRGTGASRPGHAYASRFFQALNASFPHPAHAFINHGMGGTTSTIFAACTEQLVPPDADLVVLEFTYNDQKDGGYSKPSRRAFEQLLRRLLRLPSPPAVALLHHYAWGATSGDGLPRGLYYYPPEQQLTTFATVGMPGPVLGRRQRAGGQQRLHAAPACPTTLPPLSDAHTCMQYYDIPVVSMRSAVWRLMQAGIDGFRVCGAAAGKAAAALVPCTWRVARGLTAITPAPGPAAQTDKIVPTQPDASPSVASKGEEHKFYWADL